MPSDLDCALENTGGGIKIRLWVEILYLTYSEGVTLARCLSYLNL